MQLKINVSSRKNNLIVLFLLITTLGFGQGFVTEVEEDGLSALFGNPCTVELTTGETITGKLTSGSLINGYLSNFTIKSESGEKSKFSADEVKRLTIKASKLAKLTMVAESTSSIKEMTHTNFEDIINREYIVFETAMRHNKSEKLRLMQLLNPGFDSKIKVFGDPDPNRQTSGIGLGGIKLTGGIDKSYLFVQNDQKAVLVKKGSYNKDFTELYANCLIMLQAFAGEKIKWADLAGHVYAYEQLCTN